MFDNVNESNAWLKEKMVGLDNIGDLRELTKEEVQLKSSLVQKLLKANRNKESIWRQKVRYFHLLEKETKTQGFFTTKQKQEPKEKI